MELAELVAQALAEDVGAGDVTTAATVPGDARAVARIWQKAPGVIYGLDVAEAVFAQLDHDASFERLVVEGVWRERGGRVLEVHAHTRALLTGERTALNFLGHLSGVATMAARAVQEVAGTGAGILDTRKTTPGLRALEKAAVRAGGADNHRFGLHDAILIKENHIAAAGGIAAALTRARAAAPALADTLEVEVRDASEIEAALAAGATRLLLDNMDDAQLRAAVEQVAGRAQLESSGGVTLENVRARALTGVEWIPSGRFDTFGAGARPLPHPGVPLMKPMALPMAPPPSPEPSPAEIKELQGEIRALAAQGDALILAHNYQLPEVQDVADYVGDSLGLSRRAAAAGAQTIVFCGVHFMAETASILCPEKTVLIPDLDAGCSLAASIDAEQLSAWKEQHPEGVVVMYVNTSAEVKALSDYCVTSSNAVAVVRRIYELHGPDTEILFGPDMWLGAYVEKELGRPMHVWDGECHVHAGIRPADIEATRAEHPEADFLIHPECGCSTSVMEYVSAGDIDSSGVHMLSTGGMLDYARKARPGADVVVATETGMLHPLRMASPETNFIAANPRASCSFMKMITLPKVSDSLRELQFEVKVPEHIARRARLPIDRMVEIG